MNFKNIFQKKKKIEPVTTSTSDVEVVFYNDAVTLVERCCRCCTNSTPAKEYDKKIEYIAKRIKTHHESILEHSNVVLKVLKERITAKDYEDIIDNIRYVNVVKDSRYIYMAASVRGWKEFIRHADMESPLPKKILDALSLCVPKSLMIDMVENNLFGIDEYTFPKRVDDFRYESEFTNDEDEEFFSYLNEIGSASCKSETRKVSSCINFDTLTMDDINYNDWKFGASAEDDKCEAVISDINMYDFLKLGTVTICFENMSRAATHQIVRHRNAITQESMRYVNYSDATFYIPENLKSANINVNGKGVWTASSVCKFLQGFYDAAVKSGIPKEDARGLLPNATECGQLYMTFTWYNFIKFLQLRMDKAAQKEIREFACAAYDIVAQDFNNMLIPFGVTIDEAIEHIDEWFNDDALPLYTLQDIDEKVDAAEADSVDENVGIIEK